MYLIFILSIYIAACIALSPVIDPHMMKCLICKNSIDLPYSLPCTHVFCYICILRHLQVRNFCPECFLFPLHPTDLSSESIEVENDLPKIKFNLLGKVNLTLLKRKLKEFQLSTDGNKDVLTWRLNEFLTIYSCEKQYAKPKSRTEIARMVCTTEKLLYREYDDENIRAKSLLLLKKIKYEISLNFV